MCRYLSTYPRNFLSTSNNVSKAFHHDITKVSKLWFKVNLSVSDDDIRRNNLRFDKIQIIEGLFKVISTLKRHHNDNQIIIHYIIDDDNNDI